MRAPLWWFCGLWLVAAPAQAISLVSDEVFTFDLGGYARALSGVQQQRLRIDPQVLTALEQLSAITDPALAAAALGITEEELATLRALPKAQDPSGLHSGIVRFQWTSTFGEHVHLELHNRFSWQVQSTPADLSGGRLGLGVSQVPGRTVDTRAVIVEDPSGHFVFQHEIDRLALRLNLGPVDVVLGRQAITWGNSTIFLVADLWTNFSPFELDQSQKPGIDAARLLTQFNDFEIDVVVAGRQSFDELAQGRGDWTNLSLGARATFYLPFGDVYGAVAKHWDLIMLHGGVSAAFDVATLRAEITQAYDTSRERLDLPRATVGVDLFGPDLTVTLEGHFNGLGAETPGAYLTNERTLEALGRGETYLLGRAYVGTAVVYRPWELITLGFTTLANVLDVSLMFAGFMSYSPTENLELTLGAFTGAGVAPDVDLAGFRLNSEYGTYGDLFYFQIAAFF